MSRAHQGTYLRTAATWERYQHEPKRNSAECFMCNAYITVKRFDHWYTMTNEYPYDEVASKHRMLAPKRHVARDSELNREELSELNAILFEIEMTGEYDCILKNFPVGQSHPSHLHYHLITWKRR